MTTTSQRSELRDDIGTALTRLDPLVAAAPPGVAALAPERMARAGGSSKVLPFVPVAVEAPVALREAGDRLSTLVDALRTLVGAGVVAHLGDALLELEALTDATLERLDLAEHARDAAEQWGAKLRHSVTGALSVLERADRLVAADQVDASSAAHWRARALTAEAHLATLSDALDEVTIARSHRGMDNRQRAAWRRQVRRRADALAEDLIAAHTTGPDTYDARVEAQVPDVPVEPCTTACSYGCEGEG